MSGEQKRECRECRNVRIGPRPDGQGYQCHGCFFAQPCYPEAANCEEFVSRSWIPGEGAAND